MERLSIEQILENDEEQSPDANLREVIRRFHLAEFRRERRRRLRVFLGWSSFLVLIVAALVILLATGSIR